MFLSPIAERWKVIKISLRNISSCFHGFFQKHSCRKYQDLILIFYVLCFEERIWQTYEKLNWYQHQHQGFPCRKHPTRQFYKLSVLRGIVSWKIISVITKFWESSPGKFDLFLWYFFLLENLMCSNEIFDKISWKIWSVLMVFFSPGKSYVFLRNFEKAILENLYVFLYHFWFSWKKMVCSYKRIMSSTGKFICVLIISMPPGNFDVF